MNVAPAGAHGFGQRYDLPLPLSLYLFGGATAVALSFVVVGLFVRRTPRAHAYSRVDLFDYRLGKAIAALGIPLKLIALVLFAAMLAAGFFGDQNPYRNLAPTLVWIIVWIGLAYISAFVGNIWPVINPWRTVFDGTEMAYRRACGCKLALNKPYPPALGVWPAVLLLLAFSWTELVYPTPAVPSHIVSFALGYSVLTWAGMLVFGSQIWLRHGELFTVVFSTFARFAPTDICTAQAKPQLLLRPFGAGLIGREQASPSMMALVLLLLSSVLYDGLIATPEWSVAEAALMARLSDVAELGPVALRSIGLVGFWLLFVSAYLIVSAIMSAMTEWQLSPRQIAQNFALTLIPIALGYHLAHYLVYFLIQGQYIIPLLSDPFGNGWNLFGTASYRPNIAIVGARFAWYSAVVAVLLGHIAAVYLAHARAMHTFAPHKLALASQIPLTALMVVYTFVSLSILAEPIVERSRPSAQPSAVAGNVIVIPADAVLPDLDSGRLQPIGPDKFARTKLVYRLLGSAFHDGTKMTTADLLYTYIFAYSWGIRSDGRETHYDPSLDTATAPIRRQLAGLRIAGSETASKSFRVGDVDFLREVFTIEVYTTSAPASPEREAVPAPPWSTLPWHLLVLMEEAVDRNWAAFSETEAVRRGVEWLDLVRSQALNARLLALIESFEREGYRPEALRPLVGVDEARRRWAALSAFYRANGHFLVTNGPYQLKSWSHDSVVLSAFRDLSYPLGVGSYDSYAIPRRGFITAVDSTVDGVRLSGDIEMIDKFQRRYRIKRVPLSSIPPDVLKRMPAECRIVVVDDQKRVVLAGATPLSESSSFQFDFKNRLPAGRYTMFAVVTLNGNVMNADIRQIPIVVSSDRKREESRSK
ncbi:hypothetical protein OZ411_18125 [Bradyrhizobium sp. Arg237L]|uniref:hypothetical protein n=1 Tax=Bradyrhizobium sp. Arg237L TaxID=3003352 RepID=UPI00249DAC9E|nr:hypothetical protein [Bradyrhizobium sp. Arg237L]MDI4234724.1 hypothetical protein [Bradyrhizobium sp. Arg237L]